jgi:hypothetical protein
MWLTEKNLNLLRKVIIMTRYVVMNENVLGCIRDETPNTLEVIHASVLRGADYGRFPAPLNISPSDNIRPATKADFDKFCVFSKGYLGY